MFTFLNKEYNLQIITIKNVQPYLFSYVEAIKNFKALLVK